MSTKSECQRLQKLEEKFGYRRAVEYCLCAEVCKQMQKGSGNKYALLFPVLKYEALSISDSIHMRDHLYRQSHFIICTCCKTGIRTEKSEIVI